MIKLLKTIMMDFKVQKNEISILEFANHLVKSEDWEGISIDTSGEYTQEWTESDSINYFLNRKVGY